MSSTTQGMLHPVSMKHRAKHGAMWVALTSAAAVPMAYYRNWIFGRIGETGEVVGQYAIILLFIQIVMTFVLFGGSTVVTNYLPKIKRQEDKSAFLLAYALLSVAAVIVFVALMNLFPSMVSFLIRKPVSLPILRVLSLLAPTIVFSQMVVFSLAGLLEFKLSSLLSQIQIVLMCTLGTALFFFHSEDVASHATILFATAIGLAHFVVIVIGIRRVLASLPGFTSRLYLPAGFWRFSFFIHLNTISTFAYGSIDQLFVLSALGTKELGAYFILLQCAQLITFVPKRISQVMLASFSHLVGSGNHAELLSAYTKLCRMILIFSTPLTLLMILFSHPIARLFGEWYAERHFYLLFLAGAIHIGSLGNVNSMLIMAKESTGIFLANSIILISLQLAATLLLLDHLGVFAVIAGKAIGIVSGQVGLFSIVRWKLDQIRQPPPFEYWIALLVTTIATAISVYLNPLTLIWAAFAFLILSASFLLLIRFRWQEILTLFNRQSPRPVNGVS